MTASPTFLRTKEHREELIKVTLKLRRQEHDDLVISVELPTLPDIFLRQLLAVEPRSLRSTPLSPPHHGLHGSDHLVYRGSTPARFSAVRHRALATPTWPYRGPHDPDLK